MTSHAKSFRRERGASARSPATAQAPRRFPHRANRSTWLKSAANSNWDQSSAGGREVETEARILGLALPPASCKPGPSSTSEETFFDSVIRIEKCVSRLSVDLPSSRPPCEIPGSRHDPPARRQPEALARLGPATPREFLQEKPRRGSPSCDERGALSSASCSSPRSSDCTFR